MIAMGPLPPLIVGIFVLGRTVFALLSGAASADNKGILRDDEPIAYWVIVAAGFAGAALLFIISFR
jgi:hypothetical protein